VFVDYLLERAGFSAVAADVAGAVS
jgi:hypothetical protein